MTARSRSLTTAKRPLIRGATRLLGRAGLANVVRHAVTIAGSGRKPVIVVLTERNGDSVSMIVSVAGLQQPTLH